MALLVDPTTRCFSFFHGFSCPRQVFTGFCLQEDYVVASTWFQKCPRDLITFRYAATPNFDPPLTHSKFAQIDHVLINRRWRNAIQDVRAISNTSVDSDHKLLAAKVKVKLANKKRAKIPVAPKYRSPIPEQLSTYNSTITKVFNENVHLHTGNPLTFLATCLKTAAAECLTPIPPSQQKPFITESTWNLLQQRQQAQEQGNAILARSLSHDIKKAVCKDKEEHLKAELEEIENHSYKWTGLKRMRARPNLKFTKFKDKYGNRIPSAQYPQRAAEYLAHEQWKNDSSNLPPKKSNPKCLTERKFPINDSQFTLNELNEVIRKQSNNKTPGTDLLRVELVKYLNSENKSILLGLINDSFHKGELESSLHEARVVSLYKKGDSSKLENYRPISLLQTFYKIIAALIKNRLAQGLEQWIMNTQYGFRAGKSTSHAIFLARRLQSLAEITGTNIAIVMLDWEKAFDKVNHERLLESLTRVEVPPNLLALIRNIYSNPQFKVCCREGESNNFTQNAGIRQGCPLSPYLFIILMSTIFSDIREKLSSPKQQSPMTDISFSQILYADDTLIFGDHTQSINKLLKEIEMESSYYGLKLNYNKCVNLTTNRKTSTIKYRDGSKVPRSHRAVYLGTLLTDTVDNSAEIHNRMAMAMVTFQKLQLFWDKANTTTAWKLRVYNAIIKTKLLYSLETIQLTKSELSKIDAFHMKGLRRILKIPSTYIDRTQTNDVVLQKANETGTHTQRLSESWKEQKLKLLGHILRADHSDPLRQVLFESGTNIPRYHIIRRSGRPKLDWLLETMKDALLVLGQAIPRDIDHTHVRIVATAAQQRIRPF